MLILGNQLSESLSSLALNNPRLHYAYLNWDKMNQEKKVAIRSKAAQVLVDLEKGLL